MRAHRPRTLSYTAGFASLLLLGASACSGSDAAPTPPQYGATGTSSGTATASAATTTGAATPSTTGGTDAAANGVTTAGAQATGAVTTGQADTTGLAASTSTSATNNGTTTTTNSSGVGGATGTDAAATSTTGAISTVGCGASAWPEDGEQSLDVNGTLREFITSIPDDYDPSTPYRLVFAFHGRGGSASDVVTGYVRNYFGLQSRMSDTIFVGPQALGTAEDANDTGWGNIDGQDIDFVEAMLSYFESNYCIDSSRIFSTGFSYGGIMSNTIACELGSRFRGIAPIAGALFGFGNSCTGEPVAGWFAHGSADMDVTAENGERGRDSLLAANGCDAEAAPTPVAPEPCVEYQGCNAGYPVHWCLHTGGHTVPEFTQDGIANFFMSL